MGLGYEEEFVVPQPEPGPEQKPKRRKNEKVKLAAGVEYKSEQGKETLSFNLREMLEAAGQSQSSTPPGAVDDHPFDPLLTAKKVAAMQLKEEYGIRVGRFWGPPEIIRFHGYVFRSLNFNPAAKLVEGLMKSPLFDKPSGGNPPPGGDPPPDKEPSGKAGKDFRRIAEAVKVSVQTVLPIDRCRYCAEWWKLGMEKGFEELENMLTKPYALYQAALFLGWGEDEDSHAALNDKYRDYSEKAVVPLTRDSKKVRISLPYLYRKWEKARRDLRERKKELSKLDLGTDDGSLMVDGPSGDFGKVKPSECAEPCFPGHENMLVKCEAGEGKASWRIRFRGGKPFIMLDCLGLNYIAELIRLESKPIKAPELYEKFSKNNAAYERPKMRSHGMVFEEGWRDEVKERIREYEKEKEEARRDGRLNDAKWCESEIVRLKSRLKRGIPSDDPPPNVQKSVSKAIDDAIKSIKSYEEEACLESPLLSQFFKKEIQHGGYNLRYKSPIKWLLEEPEQEPC